MTQVTNILISQITAGRNDRTKFDPKALRELADSIAANTLIQPPTVRPIGHDSNGFQRYEIIAGERRFRAIGLLGWTEIPCLVADKNEEEASVAMLIENVQRKDLDPIDEGNAFDSRMKQFGWDIDTLAGKTGLSRIYIQYRIKLLKLRDDLQALIKSGDFKLGYAQILADADLDSNFQMLAFRRLRDHANPTPGWFRRLCSELLEKQAQVTMFDAPLFGGPALEAQATEQPADPPHPATTIPPRCGETVREVLAGQAAFWTEAAGEWARLGKSFKKQECEAAAFALKSALFIL